VEVYIFVSCEYLARESAGINRKQRRKGIEDAEHYKTRSGAWMESVHVGLPGWLPEARWGFLMKFMRSDERRRLLSPTGKMNWNAACRSDM